MSVVLTGGVTGALAVGLGCIGCSIKQETYRGDEGRSARRNADAGFEGVRVEERQRGQRPLPVRRPWLGSSARPVLRHGRVRDRGVATLRSFQAARNAVFQTGAAFQVEFAEDAAWAARDLPFVPSNAS